MAQVEAAALGSPSKAKGISGHCLSKRRDGPPRCGASRDTGVY